MGRITSRLPNLSPPTLVGSLGASELLFTSLSPSRASELIGTAAESSTMGAILASISIVGTELELIANLAGMLFFGYAVYEFLPRVFPEALTVVVDRRGYRLLAVGFVVVAAETVGRLFLNGGGFVSGSEASGNILTVVGVAVIPFVVCVGYVSMIVFRNSVDIGTASRVASERLEVTDLDGESNATGGASLRDHLTDVFRVGFFAAIPLPFLAGAVASAGLLYPVPELTAIGWAIIGVVDARFDRGFGDRLPDRDRTDFEGSAFDLVANAVRSSKGPETVALTLTGFGLAIGIVGVLNSIALGYAREGLITVSSDPLYAWSVLGTILVLFASGLFAVWFWIRVIRRIPAYLQTWNAANAEASPLADETIPESPTRPVGLLLPFAVTILPAVAFTQILQYNHYFGFRTGVLTVYGVVCLLSLVVLAWTVRRTHRAESQPPSSDGHALPVALLMELLVIILLPPMAMYVGRASGIQVPPRIELIEALLILIGFMIFIFVSPDLEARANDAEGWRSEQQHIAAFGVGVILAVGGLGDLFNIGFLGVVLGIFGALFVGISTYNIVTSKLL